MKVPKLVGIFSKLEGEVTILANQFEVKNGNHTYMPIKQTNNKQYNKQTVVKNQKHSRILKFFIPPVSHF